MHVAVYGGIPGQIHNQVNQRRIKRMEINNGFLFIRIYIILFILLIKIFIQNLFLIISLQFLDPKKN